MLAAEVNMWSSFEYGNQAIKPNTNSRCNHQRKACEGRKASVNRKSDKNFPAVNPTGYQSAQESCVATILRPSTANPVSRITKSKSGTTASCHPFSNILGLRTALR